MTAILRAIRRTTHVLVACTALVCVVPAAADEGWLAGISVSQAQLQDFRLPTTSADDTRAAWSAYGGYKFRGFAIAAGYLDLGKYRFEGPSFGGYTQDVEAYGFHFFAVGTYPVTSRVDLLGTVGAFRWTYKFSGSDPSDPDRKLSDTGVSPSFGLGVNYRLSETGGAYLHAGWQRLKSVGDRNTVEHENDFDLIQVGVVYLFGK
jgi:predicted porin